MLKRLDIYTWGMGDLLTSGIFPDNDSQTPPSPPRPPPPSFKNDNLGLLQIRILHLRKRREKSQKIF